VPTAISSSYQVVVARFMSAYSKKTLLQQIPYQCLSKSCKRGRPLSEASKMNSYYYHLTWMATRYEIRMKNKKVNIRVLVASPEYYSYDYYLFHLRA